jgi:hypothetical protein
MISMSPPSDRKAGAVPSPVAPVTGGTAGVTPSIECPYCHGNAPRITGRDLYPHRTDLYDKLFFRCLPCGAWVGCHPDGKPMGRLANSQLRNARHQVHIVFDPLWQSARQLYDGWNAKIKNVARIRAYEWLADRLGIALADCHIGMFDLHQCREAWRVIHRENPTAASIRAWAKARRQS